MPVLARVKPDGKATQARGWRSRSPCVAEAPPAPGRSPGPRVARRRRGAHGPDAHPRDPLSPAVVLPTESSLPDPGSATAGCSSWVGLAAPSLPVSSVPGGCLGSEAPGDGDVRLEAVPFCSTAFGQSTEPGCAAAARELSIEVEVTGCLANVKPRKLKRSSRIIK